MQQSSDIADCVIEFVPSMQFVSMTDLREIEYTAPFICCSLNLVDLNKQAVL